MPLNFQAARTVLAASRTRLTALPVPQNARPPIVAAIDFDQLSIFARAYETSAPLAGVPLYAIATIGAVPPPPRLDAALGDGAAPDPIVHVPLGLIGSNHAGYASFDLTVLRATGVIDGYLRERARVNLPAPDSKNPVTLGLRRLWLFPFADPLLALDALERGDIGPRFIALRLELDEVELAARSMDQPAVAMQNPNILDWRLCPGSFTLAGAVLVGQDGCETLLPSNLATQQIRFRQVAQAGRTRQERETSYMAGHVLEYTTEWFAVGHSLGQLMYSLPLAPGEVVKLAVVDWSRADSGGRTEDTGLTESLVHDQVRDRTLTESVHAVLDEWQRGGSIMGGAAASGGAGIAGGGLTGAGIGLTAALGGAYSTSSGTRDLAAQTTQKIADSFHQASTAMRELRSTVLVQSNEAEASKVQTRVVANYNHSHALTLLYYEVLRHYRVVTRLASVRPVVLISYQGLGKTFDKPDDVIPHRKLLESFLLDTRLMSCFDAAEKLLAFTKDTPPPTPDVGATKFVLFQLRFTTTNYTSPCDVKGWLRNDANDPATAIPLKAADGISFILADSRRFEDENFTVLGQGLAPAGGVAWKDFGFLVLHFDSLANANGNNHTGLAAIDVSGIDEAGVEHPLGHVGPSLFEGDTPDANRYLAISMSRPPVPPPPTEARMRLSDAERTDVERLYTHLQANAAYYNRALWLNEDPNVRAQRFTGLTLAGMPLLSVIENRALEVLGEFVAFPAAAGLEEQLSRPFELPLDDGTMASDAFVEQLLAMPTRGLFGEAKLGHCNSSEMIDPARFWDWQKSPIQFTPPDITGADAGSRARDVQGLAPTPFPQSLVNIVNPQSLPDPTGLGDALKVLGTPNIFRDQSGIQEVGTLLGKLSDNATGLASQAMKGQAQKELIDQIRNASELTPAQKSELIGDVLTGQASPAKPGTSTGSDGSTPASSPPASTPAPTAPSTTPSTPPAATTPAPTPPSSPQTTKPQRPNPAPQPRGLAFMISFQTPVVSTTAEGTATIDIFPAGKPAITPQGDDQGYTPGVTIGPPTKTAAPEFHYNNRPFVGGRPLTLQTENATAPGNIHIVADYNLLTFKRDDVVNLLAAMSDTATTRLNTERKTFHYDNSVAYKQPAQGSIVMIEVTPHVYTATITGETGAEAATEFSSKVGANAEILSVEGGGTSKAGSSTKNSGSWTIYYVTGGLDIVQKN